MGSAELLSLESQDAQNAEPDLPRHVLEQTWARRAAQLAQVLVQEETSERIELVLVRLGREVYGLSLQCVFEVCPVEPHSVTHVPRAPEWVAGVVNLRGRILSVIDLRRFLGLPGAENVEDGEPSEPGLVFVQTPEMELALLTVKVLAVVSLPANQIQNTADTMQSICSEYVQGIARLDGSMLSIVDLPALLADKRLTIREEIA